MTQKALLVLEGPWWTPETNPKRPSVLPFLQGLEKLTGSFNVYYSNFYEIAGFKRALRDDLTHTREKRLFLYIAAHGSGRKVASSDYFAGIRLQAILAELKTLAQYKNLEGVVIGSCEIGNNTQEFLDAIAGSRIRWIFGYKCEITWLVSTMVDLSVFEHLMELRESSLSDQAKIINAFVRALRRFNGEYRIGHDKDTGGPVELNNAVSLVIQPLGKGKKPRDVTDVLTRKLGWIGDG